MGLDMYLFRNIYIGAQYEHREVKGTVDIEIRGKNVPINLNELSEIVLIGIQWRKAHVIHKWFVDNIQHGDDDCRSYYLEIDDLQQLYDLCCETIKNKAVSNEPGFVFGPNEYEDYDFEDVVWTKDQLKEIIDNHNNFYTYTYESSW